MLCYGCTLSNWNFNQCFTPNFQIWSKKFTVPRWYERSFDYQSLIWLGGPDYDSNTLVLMTTHFISIGIVLFHSRPSISGLSDRPLSVTVMLVTSLCWWLYDGDWFQMLVADLLCWRLLSLSWWFSQCIKSVTNILNQSPTHLVSNIRHQHRCNHCDLVLDNFSLNRCILYPIRDS